MHKTMESIVSMEKIEIIRSQEFMPNKARVKFLKKMIILGPKTAFWGLNFVEFWCWGLIFGGRGGPGPQAPWIRPWITKQCKCNISQDKLRFKEYETYWPNVVDSWITF